MNDFRRKGRSRRNRRGIAGRLDDVCGSRNFAAWTIRFFQRRDVLSLRHSLHRKPSDAKGFYAIYCGLIVIAAGLVLTPGAPLGLLTNAVQTLAGVLLPSATVFLLLLCNDKAVLGPWANGRWLNIFTGGVIAVLVMLSIILTASVMFPEATNETVILAILGGGGILGVLIALGTMLVRGGAGKTEPRIRLGTTSG